mmetsp:Transcript_15336/g.45425  ORF Transcript_15336/g.45425 Transcript_15336/m.45425 type:complete len:215 (+) Transcript_15336:820-1464(+)
MHQDSRAMCPRVPAAGAAVSTREMCLSFMNSASQGTELRQCLPTAFIQNSTYRFPWIGTTPQTTRGLSAASELSCSSEACMAWRMYPWNIWKTSSTPKEIAVAERGAASSALPTVHCLGPAHRPCGTRCATLLSRTHRCINQRALNLLVEVSKCGQSRRRPCHGHCHPGSHHREISPWRRSGMGHLKNLYLYSYAAAEKLNLNAMFSSAFAFNR